MEAATLQARMPSPAFVVPGAIDALQALDRAIGASGLSETTRELVHLRASQINGCGVCAVQHSRIARRRGESEERMWAVACWQDAPYFDAAERAALALAEALTRSADRPDAVPDEVWAQAAEHYDETQLGALVLTISSVNLWNRLNVATRQVAGIEW